MTAKGKMTPESPAEPNTTAKTGEWKATRAYRDGLTLGLPPEWIRDSLIRSGGCSPELADRALARVRAELREHSTVHRDHEVAITLERLELLYSLLVQKGDYRTALEVVRERARFTRAENFVRYTSSEEKRERSERDKVLDDLGPAGRERLVHVLRGIVIESAEYVKRTQAIEQEQERIRKAQEANTGSDSDSGSST